MCWGCGSANDGAGPSQNAVLEVLQDLDLDPEGRTTVLTFAKPLLSVDPGHFAASGGQDPVAATLAGSQAVVSWDDIVSPAHQVKVVGQAGLPGVFHAVTTSDASAPQAQVLPASQGLGLGNDTLEVQFSGPHVQPAQAEDPGNWELQIAGEILPWSGSSFDFDVGTQRLTVLTGPQTNLHANFQLRALSVHSVADVPVSSARLAGSASGDSQPPSLVSAQQNLLEDEFGRVVDFEFDEAMDPLFCAQLEHFQGYAPDISLLVVQVAPELLRVTFSNPIVPGKDSVLLDGLMDAHGNLLPSGPASVSAGSTVANGLAQPAQLVTVQNAGGDHLEIEFLQALDPDTAVDPTRWEAELHPPSGQMLDLSQAELTFDLEAKLLTVEFDVDFHNSDELSFRPVPGNPPLDVDGEDFSLPILATASGDASLPAILSAVQNRNVDPSGKTLDVTFGEDVDQSTAENLAHWSVSGAAVLSAQRQAGFEVVRLALDQPAVPGLATLGASGVTDLAGNVMAAVAGLAITSTDLVPPALLNATAQALEGAGNDRVVVRLDDDMLESTVENALNWTVESPIGTPLNLAGAQLVYQAGSRSAAVIFAPATGVNLQRDDDFQVTLAGMLDVGGNVMPPSIKSGPIQIEERLPTLDLAWVEAAVPTRVHARFSEPCAHLTDVAGHTHYVVRDALGTVKGTPLSAALDADGMGATLDFGVVVAPYSDTLDVLGLRDLAGNPYFPGLSRTIASEDPQPLEFDAGQSQAITVYGEENDQLLIDFLRTPSSWGVASPNTYELSIGGQPLSLDSASFEFDGLSLLTVRFDASGGLNLATGATYDFGVVGPLATHQGVSLPAPIWESFTAAGDSTPPDLPLGRTRLDAGDPLGFHVLIEFDEALEPSQFAGAAPIALNGAFPADGAVLLGQRTVRADFSSVGPVAVGDSVTCYVGDLAGNATLTSQSVAPPESAGPTLVAVVATAVPSAGGDRVELTFDRPVDTSSAFLIDNYSLSQAGSALDLTGTSVRYVSSTHTLSLRLRAGLELSTAMPLSVGVENVLSHDGFPVAPSTQWTGAVGGDLTAPTIAESFLDRRAMPDGTRVVLRFSEDVDVAAATHIGSWSTTGPAGVVWVEHLFGGVYRLQLSQPMLSSDLLQVGPLEDLAGNGAALLSTQPVP